MAQAQAARGQAGSQAKAQPGQAQKLVQELKVSAHLMTLEPGVFCIFNAPGDQRIDEGTGFPGVRVSIPPGRTDSGIDILSFGEEGWLGGRDSAVLVRIADAPAEVVITIYQREGAAEPAPKIQIQQLSDGAAPVSGPARAVATQVDVANAEVAAHIQRRGDVVASLGEWMGEKGSQRWIEGFSLAPRGEIGRENIEYQAVLGRGWLSPWSEGGQYCGSRGMALPILGLRARLKGDAAQRHTLRVSATFTDGATAGPVDGSRTCEAESLAPLEAFMIEIVPIDAARRVESSEVGRPRTAAPRGPTRTAVAKPPTWSPAKGPAKAPSRGKTDAPGRRK